jgi:CBS domain-containing protein
MSDSAHRSPESGHRCDLCGHWARRLFAGHRRTACAGSVLRRAHGAHPPGAGSRRPAGTGLCQGRACKTAGSICRREVVGVKAEDPFMSAYRLMLAEEVRAVPVLNEENEVCGILHFRDLLQLLLPGGGSVDASRTPHASLLNIALTLGANAKLGASRETTVEKRLQRATAEGNVSQYVVICGDRPAGHQFALDYGVRALIITAGHGPDPELAEEGRAWGMTIICSPHDTAMTVRLALCARCVSHVLSDRHRGRPRDPLLVGEAGGSGFKSLRLGVLFGWIGAGSRDRHRHRGI